VGKGPVRGSSQEPESRLHGDGWGTGGGGGGVWGAGEVCGAGVGGGSENTRGRACQCDDARVAKPGTHTPTGPAELKPRPLCAQQSPQAGLGFCIHKKVLSACDM
jgi:hypothetical protein